MARRNQLHSPPSSRQMIEYDRNFVLELVVSTTHTTESDSHYDVGVDLAPAESGAVVPLAERIQPTVRPDAGLLRPEINRLEVVDGENNHISHCMHAFTHAFMYY